MENKIFSMLIEENEITWQTIIQDLVKNEEMDPWDVDVSKLSQRYIETLKQLKGHDFRVSGKVVLAAAILLKIKSSRFIDEDMLELDRLINQREEISEDDFYEDLMGDFHTPGNVADAERHKLIPRTPQPRKRKVSIYDLMGALDQALEVRRRRIVNSLPSEDVLIPPAKGVDLHVIIKNIYTKIRRYYSNSDEMLTFSQLVPSDDRAGKIFAFIPLLHLSNMRKIDLGQEGHLSEIEIEMINSSNKKQLDKELGQAA